MNTQLINNTNTKEEKFPVINRKLALNQFKTLYLCLEKYKLTHFHITYGYEKPTNPNCTLYKLQFTHPDKYAYYVKKQFLKNILIDLSGVDLIHFAMGVTEFGENKDRPHYHVLVAFRALSTNVSALKYQIISSFVHKDIPGKDIEIKLLLKEQDIYNVFNYLTKELNDDEDSLFQIAQYSYLLSQELDDTGNNSTGLREFYSQFRLVFTNWRKNLSYQFLMNETPTAHLHGIQIERNRNVILNSTYLMLYYISLYFQLKEMFLYKGGLYKKIPNTLFSYEYLGDLIYLQNNLLSFLIELGNFLPSITIKSILKLYTIHMKEIIKLTHETSLCNKREINFNILEFKDCIYFAKYNKFIMKDELKQRNLNILTIRYYPYTYNKIVSRTYRTLWAKKLQVQFEFKNQFYDFCASFSAILFDFDLETKQKALFLLGVSGAGKTSLVTNIATDAYRLQNTGSINADDIKFTLANLLNKDLGVVDEMTYSKRLRSTLLKLFSNESVLVNQKFKNSEFLKLTQNIIMSGNPSKELNDMLLDPAFQSRINLFLFEQVIDLNSEEKKQIQKELPFILILCARIYFYRKYNAYNRKLIRKEFKKKYLTKENKWPFPRPLNDPFA